MKTIVRLLLLSFLLQSFQCDEEKTTFTQVTPQELIEKKTTNS